MQPKISIVIPVYNVGQYLCQCLDSIITQTIQDYEVILVDDGSTDESPSICDKYAEKNKRFTVIHQKNEGSAKARNTGLDKATGEYIAFIDSDDWINEDHLQNLQKRAEETEADIVISSYYFFDGKQDTYVINKASKLDSRTIIMETLNGLLHAGLWNKLFRRGFLVKKEIRFPEHGYYEDMFVFISSLMNTNKIAFSSTATYHYRVNPTSQTFSHDLNKRLSSYDEMIENFELLEKKYHLSQDQEILNALYREINANRQNLFISFRKDAKKLSEHFKKHPIPLVLRDTSPLWGGYSISLANTELAGHTSSMASEEKFPELSIIIPVYNVEKYLRQCLDSILTQTSQNYEVILVDDGSTDESPAICDQYAKKDKRFKVIHKKNEGVSVARNAGIDICTGEFISFVDSDDWLEPTYVSTLICQMRNADLIFFSHIVHSEDGLKSSYQLKEKFIDNENAKEDFILHLFNNMLYVDFYGYTWNKAFRRDIIMKNNIRFVSGLTFYEDEIFTNDYIMHVKKVRSISTPLYNYNWKVGGLSFSKKKSWQYFKLAEKTNEFAQSLETENAILFFKKRAENMLLMGLSDSDMSLGQWYKAFKKLKDQNGQQFSTRHIARIIYKRFVGSRSKDA